MTEIEFDPIIAALFNRLPEPDTVWPEAERQLWLAAFKSAVDLVYPEPTLRHK